MSDVIAEWLERLGLGQYALAFRENAIGPEHLPELDHETLKEIGVHPVGHRITILKAASIPATEVPSKEPPAKNEHVQGGGAEHRQLSVMFCDLVGSTALSERLDLERYRDLLSAYQNAAREAVDAYEGYIARYMGDGLLVYFGYPTAHEDDAERAVRAGLHVLESMSVLSKAGDIDLQVRVGIATGRVLAGDIVGAGASEERSVLGETPNLAARLQGLAMPNSVIVSDATRRLVKGRFELEPLEPQKVKGLSEPVAAFRARAIRGTSRFEAATTGGLSSFVGRKSELQILLNRWEHARAGEGQVVVLSGESGIGKSRLLRELHEHSGKGAHTELGFQCSPFGTKTAFFAVVEWLQRSAGFSEDDDLTIKLDKLGNMLSPIVDEPSTAIPLLTSLLSLPSDRYPAPAMSPQRQKIETINVLVRFLEGLARQHPLLVLFEDIHWIDPSTLEAVDAVVEKVQTLPVLVVMTHRPEFEPRWRAFGHVTHHSLNRLSRGDGKSLSSLVTGGKMVPQAVLEQILEQADGVPLFIEELTKTVLEGGLMREENGRYLLDGPLPPLAIPLTLQDSLMARLDRLASVKEVAQAAACIGREFTASVLSKVLFRSSLEEDLERLLDSGLVFRKGAGKDGAYIFKHALVQDTAHDSLLASRRQQLHARIAQVLEDSPERDPAILAYHFSAAGLSESAANYYLSAGRRALIVFALPEALSELELGLREVATLQASPHRDRLELDIRTALGASRIPYHGWSHSSVAVAYEPAFELAEKLDDVQALCCILWGLCVHYWTRAEFTATHAWLGRLEAAADRSEVSELSVVRDMAAGCQYFWEADYEQACAYTAHIRETYEERQHARIASYTNHDPLTFSLHWAGSLLQWIIGYPDQGLEMTNEAHALARRINHPFNSVFALTVGSECLLMRGDTEFLLHCCDDAQGIVDEAALGDFAQHVLVDNLRGRTCTRMGDFETGYRLTSIATSRWREAEGRICSALFWGGEALALGGLGRTGEALELIESAIDHCRNTGDRFMEPEVLRIKAELMLARDQSTYNAAEEILIESLRIAGEHKAKSWELRSATSLAGLMLLQDKRLQARDMLYPVYDWFSEGFDTADLRKARAVLDELF